MPVHYAFAEQKFFSISSPIGTQIVQATGVAYAMKVKKQARCAIAFMGVFTFLAMRFNYPEVLDGIAARLEATARDPDAPVPSAAMPRFAPARNHP